MWPWVCLVPGALVHVAKGMRARTREEKLRLFFAAWGILGYAFFTFVQTKFHHYILPAIPGLVVVLVFWFDDLWDGKVLAPWIAICVAIGLFIAVSIDLVPRQERLVALFTYRYDRSWPYGAPWNIDFTLYMFVFAVAFGGVLILLNFPAWRRAMTVALLGVGVVFAGFCGDILLPAASPHWGQRALHTQYYAGREIHGVDLYYYGGHEIENDWASGKDLLVKSVIPTTLKIGDPMTVKWQLRNAQEGVQEKGELQGTVAAIRPDADEFSIAIPPDERAKIAPLVEKNRGASDDKRRYLYVNADRMIAWQLNWRGENFYTGGEIWNPRDPDMQTVFMEIDNTKFLSWLKPRIGHKRKFWLVTEIARVASLAGVLPTQFAKESIETPDHSSNKFGLAKFTLDDGTAPASQPVGPPAGPTTGPTAPPRQPVLPVQPLAPVNNPE